MRKSMLMLGIAAAIAIAASTSSAAPPYFGMTKAQYDQCIRLGSEVMEAQRRGPDSRQHAAAYARWNTSCGLEVLPPFALQHGINLTEIPSSPLGWSQLR
jgi:hypothetical protein